MHQKKKKGTFASIKKRKKKKAPFPLIKLQPVSPTNTSRTPPECRRKWRVHSGGWARSYAIILNTRGWRGRQWYLILVTGGERRRHGLFKWSKTTIPRGKELESVERRWKGVGEKWGARGEEIVHGGGWKVCVSSFSTLARPFHSFRESIRISATLAFLLGKSMKRRGEPAANQPPLCL